MDLSALRAKRRDRYLRRGREDRKNNVLDVLRAFILTPIAVAMRLVSGLAQPQLDYDRARPPGSRQSFSLEIGRMLRPRSRFGSNDQMQILPKPNPPPPGLPGFGFNRPPAPAGMVWRGGFSD